jgi:N6-L-threonylcarbamoyladenine synthase
LVGRTRDDAAGEAFDKVAKLLGLGYPGGVAIEEYTRGVDPGDLTFPRALMDGPELDFSFSGVKTAVLRYVEDRFGVRRRSDVSGSFHPLVPGDLTAEKSSAIRVIAAAFQTAVVDVLAAKAVRAAQRYGSEKLVVCGGVAANEALREKMTEEGTKHGIEPVFPSVRLCTDNAAMIAARAHTLLEAGMADDMVFGAKSRW